MSYNLFLDDKRTPKDAAFKHFKYDHESIYLKADWVEASSYDDFYKLLKLKGIPKIVSFDYELSGFKTGLDCAELLKFMCEELKVQIPLYYVHSNLAGIGIAHDFQDILGKETYQHIKSIK